MNPFSFTRPHSVLDAVAQMDNYINPPSDENSRLPSAYIAGGTNLLDLMKERVEHPARLLDISHLPLDTVEPTPSGGVMIGSMVRNADTAYHPLIRDAYPMLSAAILAGASAQIRNMARNGGNLLQRTRCLYFYDIATPCNKRKPGSGCSAMIGLNRQHAILGTSSQCIATHPSDMCVALAALDANIHVVSLRGKRIIAMQDLHRLPGEYPQMDTTLQDGELITHIELPGLKHLRQHSSYLKIRDRASFAFALVSVAAALDLTPEGKIRNVHVALGGVAHKPWRDKDIEQTLVGKLANEQRFSEFAEVLIGPARSFGGNDFKIPMARRAIVRALQMALTATGH